MRLYDCYRQLYPDLPNAHDIQTGDIDGDVRRRNRCNEPVKRVVRKFRTIGVLRVCGSGQPQQKSYSRNAFECPCEASSCLRPIHLRYVESVSLMPPNSDQPDVNLGGPATLERMAP